MSAQAHPLPVRLHVTFNLIGACTSCSLGDKWVDPFLRSGYDDLRGWEEPISGVPLRPLDDRFGSEPAGVKSANVKT